MRWRKTVEFAFIARIPWFEFRDPTSSNDIGDLIDQANSLKQMDLPRGKHVFVSPTRRW